MNPVRDETAPRPWHSPTKPARPEAAPDEPHLGCFARFGLSDGRLLEIHVVSARVIAVGGHTDALEDSFILKNEDGSIEHSGSLVLLDISMGRPVAL